jgi:MFS family permease
MDPAYLSLSVSLAAVSVAAFALFLIQERRVKHPLLDLNLFSDRLFAAGNLGLLLMALSMGAVTLVVSLYLQVVRGYNALDAGLIFIPMELTFAIVGPLSGTLSDRYGSRGLTTAGMSVLGVTLLVFSYISETASYWEIAITLAFIGVGLGLFSAPNMSSIMRSTPAQRRGVASAVRSTILNSGSVISISVVAAMLVTELPYATASAMLSGRLDVVSLPDAAGFLNGIRKALLVSGVLSLIGTIPSALRGQEMRRSGAGPSGTSTSDGT